MEIIPLDPLRKKQAAAVYAHAFFDYPQFVCYFPDRAWRTRHFHDFVETWINYALRYGRVDVTPDVTGVACWLPPGKTRTSNLGFVLTGAAIWPFRIGWKNCSRMLAYEQYAEGIHKKLGPGPHWYLWGLAVDPPFQGQGIGTRLLQPVLRQADQHGLPCFLETHKAENVPFYEHSGFRVCYTQSIPGLDLPFWCMLRMPTDLQCS